MQQPQQPQQPQHQQTSSSQSQQPQLKRQQIPAQLPKVEGLRNFVVGLPQNFEPHEVENLMESAEGRRLLHAVDYCVRHSGKKKNKEGGSTEAAVGAAAAAAEKPRKPMAHVASILQSVVDDRALVQGELDEVASQQKKIALWQQEISKMNFACVGIRLCPNSWRDYFTCLQVSQQTAALQTTSRRSRSQSPPPSVTSCEVQRQALEACIGHATSRCAQVADDTSSLAFEKNVSGAYWSPHH